MPRSIISRTTSSTIAPCGSIEPAAVTDTTRPGNGPGMPGSAAGAYGVTTRYGGAGSSGARPASLAALMRAVAASGAAAIASRNALRSIVEAPLPRLYARPGRARRRRAPPPPSGIGFGHGGPRERLDPGRSPGREHRPVTGEAPVRSARVQSIDLLRGADVLLMLFVNEVAGVAARPRPG